MVETTPPPSSPFPARRASDRSQFQSSHSLEWWPQKIETAAGAQNAQIVCRRAPRVSIFDPEY
eukprot:400603-Alexandrium_andersonii.AAC.1